MKKIALTGGTEISELNILSGAKKVTVETPFGSSDLITGKVDDTEVVFLSRHGNGQNIPSCKVNFRANMFALKELKCTHILSTSSCGSLREEICPGEMIVADQFIDFTKHRVQTMNENEHNEFKSNTIAAPFSDDLRDDLIEAAIILQYTIHTKGTILTIDGPRFSTRAESYLFKTWGADVINMSTATEVALANELNIPVAALALCTGYDSWRTDIKPPTGNEIREVIEKNTEKLISLLKLAVSKI